MEPPTHPAFRRLDMHAVDQGEQRGVVLTDPLGIVDEQAFVPEGLLPVFSLFDGERSTQEIQAELEDHHGDGVPAQLVENLVRQLDERLLLLSPRFDAALAEAAASFAALTARPARHAGSAGYPADPTSLREALESIVRRPPEPVRGSPRGLVAPHIDLARDREGYSLAYSYLAECEPADLYVVFGTGHQGPSAPVTGLAIDWETPLGSVKTDRDFIDAVHQRLGTPDPLDMLLHRGEHSLEFQMLFLQHVLGERPFEVAGFLCGGLGADPTQDADAQAVITAVAAAAEASGKRVCFVAGADLAHMGPAFGDPAPVDQAHLDRLAVTEKDRLGHLERGDAGAFHRSIEGTGNAERVCGTTPMYLTAALAGGPGAILHYGQAKASDGSQVVSFCAMAFEGAATD